MTGEGAGGEDKAAVLEIYKLAVEMADRVSARRGAANAFFLSTQTALVAVVNLAADRLHSASWWLTTAVSLAGIMLSIAWAAQLHRYRELNEAKFSVIAEMEERLPVQAFQAEWRALERPARNGRGSRSVELGTLERRIPWIFATLYVFSWVGWMVTR